MTPRQRQGGEVLAQLGELLAPTRCLVCGGRSAPPWCEACRGAARSARAGCERCADPWPGHGCPFEHEPAVLSTLALWRWDGSGREVIVAAKARGAWAGWATHGTALARAVRGRGWAVDVVVGVPAARAVARRRGIDHGAVLAASVAEALGVPSPRPVRAVGRPPDQATSGTPHGRVPDEAFEVAGPVCGRVVLVDDVLTTGATARAAARALIRAGADEIRVAVLARGGRAQGSGPPTPGAGPKARA